ncbi:interleukin-26 [Rhinichthys klamathensis goyatoka]|uniref:interleukin-26 n=1 Tax=Rhinichthys klamathensis goyatoka TaxID=3034132 RepID=UPI0024B557A8|nr:interleukin-26 [Rhinichthys klamathensis goyatoka]
MRIVTLLALCALLCCSQGQMQEECLNKIIPLHMIKEMINASKFIQEPLDRDNKPFHRILGQLKNCYKKRKLNVADLKRILEIYDEHVFQKLWKNKTHQSTKMFMEFFKRLKGKIEFCETEGKQTLSSCAREKLKKIEDTFMMPEPGVQIKAMREFHNVLVWISLSMDRRRRTHKKIQ